jgi:Fur family transcriptional regulator, peroxide stress response regulator
MELVQHKLKEKGMRISHHRVKVLHLLKTHKSHLSAKQVYESIAPDIPSLSRTTVYNSLNALAQKGLIGAVMVPTGEMHYEYTEHEHCHFFCTECNAILDMEVVCGHRHAVESQGHKVQALHGCFYGVCKECQTKCEPEA